MDIYRIFIFMCFMLIWNVSYSQNVEYGTSRKTGSFELKGRGEDQVIILKDSVWYYIKDRDLRIWGDSSYYFNNRKINRLEVYGKVRVNAPDTIVITARKLVYLVNERKAFFQENVRYTDPDLSLITDSLSYDLLINNAAYYEGGRLEDDSVTLTSEYALYKGLIRETEFRHDVVLVSPEYTLYSDNLIYDSYTKIARTSTPTRVVTDDYETVAEKGLTYNTVNENTNLRRAEVRTDRYIIEGDLLDQDRNNGIYKAKGNVIMTSTENEVIITGEKADYFQKQGMTIITGLPVLKKAISEGDTMYMRADTMISFESDSAANDYLLAYRQVRLFKSDMQGKADSAIYRINDSTLTFYHDPVMWTTDTQLTGDSIYAEIAEETIKSLTTFNNAFVITSDTLNNHNQVKGREVKCYFDSAYITKVEVIGNAQSLYYVMETDSIFMGINSSTSGTMLIRMRDNAVRNISFYQSPDSRVQPPHEIREEDKRLEGYQWREEEKPDKDDVVYFGREKTTLIKSPRKLEGIIIND